MEKYLYLSKPEWQQPWINGGNIPISLASTYRKEERDAIYTPDENLIHDSSIDLMSIPGIRIEGNVKNLTFTNAQFGNMYIKELRNASRYTEDGLILSFCNVRSADIAKRLGKACGVKILDIEHLKQLIDAHLGVEGKMGKCLYTPDHRRNHFLKSVKDSWQDEFRLFWPGKENKVVTLPAGIAETLELEL